MTAGVYFLCFGSLLFSQQLEEKKLAQEVPNNLMNNKNKGSANYQLFSQLTWVNTMRFHFPIYTEIQVLRNFIVIWKELTKF